MSWLLSTLYSFVTSGDGSHGASINTEARVGADNVYKGTNKGIDHSVSHENKHGNFASYGDNANGNINGSGNSNINQSFNSGLDTRSLLLLTGVSCLLYLAWNRMKSN
jgi:hypothetical protein